MVYCTSLIIIDYTPSGKEKFSSILFMFRINNTVFAINNIVVANETLPREVGLYKSIDTNIVLLMQTIIISCY